MLIKQLSVFIENKLGRLAEVTKTLSEAGIDISSLVLSDTTDFGILRLIVNDPEKARLVLKEHDFTVNITNVVVVCIKDEPGSLSKVLDILGKEKIEIEYMYAFLGRKSGEAPVVLRVEDPDNTVKVLMENNIGILCDEDIRMR